MLDDYQSIWERFSEYTLSLCSVVGIHITNEQLQGMKEQELFLFGVELMFYLGIHLNIDVEGMPEHWESNFAKVRLLQSPTYQEEANGLFREYVSFFENEEPDRIEARLAVEEALDQLTTKRRRAELGDIIFDRLTAGAEPTSAALERDPEAGFSVRQHHTIASVLERIRGAVEHFSRRILTLAHLKDRPQVTCLDEFRQAHPDVSDILNQIRDQLNANQWNQQFLPAFEFRLAISHEKGDDFDLAALERNAFASANEFMRVVKEKDGVDLDTYLAHEMSTEALWETRITLLLSSLKLAQNGGRIKWPDGQMTDEALRTILARLNATLGEMNMIIRRGGEHLENRLTTEIELFETVLKERYANDSEFIADRVAYFQRYTSDPNSFIISMGVNHLYSAGLVLISKIDDDPVTYSIEPLYVKKNHRQRSRIGMIAENFALSVIEGLGGGRVVSTVYTDNSAMIRHLKQGAVGTTLAHHDKVLGLQAYKASDLILTKPLIQRAEDREAFTDICNEHLRPRGKYVLTSVHPDQLDYDAPPFPCRLTFQEPAITPRGGFYNPDLY